MYHLCINNVTIKDRTLIDILERKMRSFGKINCQILLKTMRGDHIMLNSFHL